MPAKRAESPRPRLCKICQDPDHPLTESNKSERHRYPCKNPAEKPYAPYAIDGEVILGAICRHLNTTCAELEDKKNEKKNVVQGRRIALYLLKLDGYLPDFMCGAKLSRDHSAVTSAIHTVNRQITNYTEDIKAVRALYEEVKKEIEEVKTKAEIATEQPAQSPQPTS